MNDTSPLTDADWDFYTYIYGQGRQRGAKKTMKLSLGEAEGFLIWELARELKLTAELSPDKVFAEMPLPRVGGFVSSPETLGHALRGEFMREYDLHGGMVDRRYFPCLPAWLSAETARKSAFLERIATPLLRCFDGSTQNGLFSLKTAIMSSVDRMEAANKSETSINTSQTPYKVVEIFPQAWRNVTKHQFLEWFEKHVIADHKLAAGRKGYDTALMDLAKFRLVRFLGRDKAMSKASSLAEKGNAPLDWLRDWERPIQRHLRLIQKLFPFHQYPDDVMKKIGQD